jgi:hypothetical protein
MKNMASAVNGHDASSLLLSGVLKELDLGSSVTLRLCGANSGEFRIPSRFPAQRRKTIMKESWRRIDCIAGQMSDARYLFEKIASLD